MLAPRISRNVPRAVRQPREGDSVAHLRFVRTLPCIVCGRKADEAHHLMRVDNLPKGVARKNPDRWCVPLCRTHHDAAHKDGDDEAYFASQGLDGRALASALWKYTGDTDKALAVILKAAQGVQLRRRG